MTNANTYIQAAIENAKEREADMFGEGKKTKTISGHCSGSVETPAGLVTIRFVVAQGVQTNMPEHMKKTYTLNSKRISVANLITILNEVWQWNYS